MEPKTRKALYAFSSFLFGLWTFVTINGISGPAFEPILEACPPSNYTTIDEFVAATGYHAYDPYVGLGVLDTLVCLITQFLLELRDTYPAGVLVWCSIIVVSLPTTVLWITEAGRAGAKGPIKYPVAMGLLGQLFGISVAFPLVWLPALVYGEGTRGAPVTPFRVKTCGLLVIPTSVLTATVFLADTTSQLWTTAAGMLGGPILAMGGLVLYADESSALEATSENKASTRMAISNMYMKLFFVGFFGWYTLVVIAVNHYVLDNSDASLLEDLWTNAGPSVKFMVIDTAVLFLSFLQYIAYRGGEFRALKAFGLSMILGPASACCQVLIEIEEEEGEKEKEETKKED